MKRWKKIWSIPGKDGEFLGWPAVVFIIVQLVIGCPLLPYVLLHWQSADSLRFACFMAVAPGGALFQALPPAIQATHSAIFLFIPFVGLDYSLSKTGFLDRSWRL